MKKRTHRSAMSLAMTLLLALTPAMTRADGELEVDVVGTRENMQAEFNEVTKRHEDLIPDACYEEVRLPDGSTSRRVKKGNKKYQAIEREWRDAMEEVRVRYNQTDPRPKEVGKVIADLKLEDRLVHTGTKRETGNLMSDVDVTGDYDDCVKLIKELQTRNPKLEIVEEPGRWRIKGQDINIYCEQAGGGASLDYKVSKFSDHIATEGGLHDVSGGKLGVEDPAGAGLGHSQKLTESGVTVDPHNADYQKGSKSASKMAELAGTKDGNPELFERCDQVRQHRTLDEAGVTTFGNPDEVKVLERQEYCKEISKEAVKAQRTLATESARLEKARTKDILQLEAQATRAPLSPAEQARLEALKVQQMKTALTNQAVIEELMVRDPEFASRLIGGERFTPELERGVIKYRNANGELLSKSEMQDAVMKRYRQTTSERLREGVSEFFKGAPRPGTPRATFVKGANWALLYHMAYNGFYRAFKEADPNDRNDPLFLKTLGKGTWYTTGLGDMHGVVWDACREMDRQWFKDMQDFRDGKRATMPNIVNYKFWGLLAGGGTLLKCMTIDPVYEFGKGVKAGADVMWYRWWQGGRDADAVDMTDRVDAYRSQTLDAAQRRLEGIIARAKFALEQALKSGDHDRAEQLRERMRDAEQALKKIELARTDGPGLDRRVQAYKDALAVANDVIYYAERGKFRPRKTISDPTSDVADPPDFDLPGLPPNAGRRDVIDWRDQCIASLNQQMENDELRRINREACLKLAGGPRDFSCENCDYSGTFYWFTDRWSCPGCERCIQPKDLALAPGGLTFTEFAQRRMKIYQDKIAEVRATADKMLAELR